MFGIFKKKKKEDLPPVIKDLHGNVLQPGDKVKSYRYDLGTCVVILEEKHYYYQSEDKEKAKISYTKMADAITGNQKVEKLDT
jgi:hypothetical protein